MPRLFLPAIHKPLCDLGCFTWWGAWQEAGLVEGEYDWMIFTGRKKLFCPRCHDKGYTPLHEGPCKAANYPEVAQKAAQIKLAKKRSAAEALSAHASAVVPDGLVVLQECKARAKGTCAET